MGFNLDKKLYSTVNHGAHRKPAPRIGAPGLVQHYAMRIPSDVEEKKNWQRAIDLFLFRLLLVLWDEFYSEYIVADQVSLAREGINLASFRCPNISFEENRVYLCRHNAALKCSGGVIDESDLISDRKLEYTESSKRSIRYETFTVHTIFRGMFLSVRAEVRTEIWTISFLADLSRVTPSALDREKNHEFKSAFARIYDLINRNIGPNDEFKQVLREPVDNEGEYHSIGEVLYSGFENLINSELISRCTDGIPEKWGSVGNVFADFRGITLGVLVSRDDDKKISFHTSEPRSESRTHRVPLNDSCKNLTFDNERALRVTDALWPCVKQFFSVADPRDGRVTMGAKKELTVTRFQGGRSLYISSLGSLDQNSRTGKIYPVKYIVVVSYENRWQLGRLIERINSMGVARLAALFDIELLHEVNERLRRLYEQWRRRPRRIGGGSERSDAVIGEVQEVAEMLDDLGSDIKFGLNYRIERSSYYVGIFESIVSDLRTRIVHGFQPYPDFVRWRMGGTFDYIKRIGIRYREIRSELELILESHRTENTRAMQKSGVEIASKLGMILERIETAARAIKDSEVSIVKLLSRAEAFLGVTITYYAGHPLQEIAEELLVHRGYDKMWSYLSYVLVGLCVAVFVWRSHLSADGSAENGHGKDEGRTTTGGPGDNRAAGR